MPEVDEEVGRDLLAAVGRLPGDGPVVLVAVSDEYAWLLDNWLCHMDALGFGRVAIVAMDEPLAERLRPLPFPVVRGAFDGSAADFWLQRARLWAMLAEAGVAFIHADADAIWLRDPVPYLATIEGDFLFSPGTIHPRSTLAAWGFVLCTGFFWARPTRATRNFLKGLVTHTTMTDDQAALNTMLTAAGTTWRTEDVESYQLDLHGEPFRCFREPIEGNCASLGLHLRLLPHHLFPRLQPGAPDAMVRHVLRTPVDAERIPLMRAAGCWRLDQHPNGFLIPNAITAA